MMKDLYGFGELNAFCTGGSKWGRLMEKVNSQLERRTICTVKKISVQKSVKDEPLFNEGPLDTHLNKNDIENNIQECFIFLLKSAGI